MLQRLISAIPDHSLKTIARDLILSMTDEACKRILTMKMIITRTVLGTLLLSYSLIAYSNDSENEAQKSNAFLAGAASVTIPTPKGIEMGEWKDDRNPEDKKPIYILSTRPDDRLKITALVLQTGDVKVGLLSVDVTCIYNGGFGDQQRLCQADSLRKFAKEGV
jgi:hypothetical protein